MFRSRGALHLCRLLAWSLAALAALAGATVIVCAIIQGPVTVYRFVSWRDAAESAREREPFRALAPSSEPFRFTPAPQTGLERLTVGGLGAVELAPLLQDAGSSAFLVVKDDRLLFERYFHDRRPGDASRIFATTTTALSTLIGLAIADGAIASVQAPVSRYIPELAEAGFDHVRLADLLQMRSKLAYAETGNPFGEHVRLSYTPRLEHEILQLHLTPKGGDGFAYKSGDAALLGLALARALKGETITAFTERALWAPLGMEFPGFWSLDHEDGLEKTWCCLSAAARDLAKIGALYRDGGVWRGARLLPEEWTSSSTREGAYAPEEWKPDAHTLGFWNYGYHWWLIDKARGDFMSRGEGGQFIYVDPGSGVVIVRLGEDGADGPKLATTDWIALFQAIADRSAEL